jgi:hypothetical protein
MALILIAVIRGKPERWLPLLSFLSHVLLLTGRLDLLFFGDSLQNAKQVFSVRLLQMTKYCVMRECENILHGNLYVLT